jgi:hypothetical protein
MAGPKMNSDFPTFPEDAAPDTEAKRSGVSAHNEAWALQRKRQIRVAAALTAALCVLTIYFAGLNAYVLYHAQPQPYSMDLSAVNRPSVAKEYRTFVRWVGDSHGASTKHPQLYVGDRVVPKADESKGIEGVSADGGTLRIDVEGASVGLHKGELVFQKREGASVLLPQETAIPVSIQVSGGFWSSWFVLRDWLIVVALLLGILYIFCVLIFPAPTGVMQVLVSRGGNNRQRSLKLGLARSAWLMPWRRATIPLKWVQKQAGVPVPMKGEVIFVGPGLPVLFVSGRLGLAGLERRRSDRESLEDSLYETYSACGAVDTMYQSNTYKVTGPADTDISLLRFTAKGIGVR